MSSPSWQTNLTKKLIRKLPKWNWMVKGCRRYVYDADGIANADIYTNGELKFLQQAIKHGPDVVIFDVGAHHGKWCQEALKINPQAEIHCFEPSAQSFKILQKKAFPPNVYLRNCALAEKQGKAEFFIYSDQGSVHDSLLLNPEKTVKSVQQVTIDTVSNYCKKYNIEHVDFLKIDAEGGDLNVLQGGKEMFRLHKISIAQFEYGEKWIDARMYLKDVFDFITPLGYQIFHITPKGLKLVPKYAYNIEHFKNSNYAVCLPEVLDF